MDADVEGARDDAAGGAGGVRRAAALAAAALLWFPASAWAPTATDGRVLQRWQASRVARGHADAQGRDGYRVLRFRRIDGGRIRVFWRDDPYLADGCGEIIAARDCFDFGSDVVELRGREFWLRDGQITGGVWVRWL